MKKNTEKKWWQRKDDPDWYIQYRDRITWTLKAEYYRTLPEIKRMAKACNLEMMKFPEDKTIIVFDKETK